MIRTAWEEQKEVRNVMVFLGQRRQPSMPPRSTVSTEGTRSGWCENPYRLAVDIFGIGFLTADSIAGKLGIGKEAPLRIETGILYVLGQLASEGHLFFPRDLLVERCAEVLEVDMERIPQALSSLAAQRKVILDEPGQLSGGVARYRDGTVYLAPLHVSEKGTAELLARLAAHPRQMRLINVEEALKWVEGTQGISFSAAAWGQASTEQRSYHNRRSRNG